MTEAKSAGAAAVMLSSTYVIVTLAIAVIVGILIGVVLTRGISLPIQKVVTAAQLIAKGDLTQKVDDVPTVDLSRVTYISSRAVGFLVTFWIDMIEQGRRFDLIASDKGGSVLSSGGRKCFARGASLHLLRNAPPRWLVPRPSAAAVGTASISAPPRVLRHFSSQPAFRSSHPADRGPVESPGDPTDAREYHTRTLRVLGYRGYSG